MNKTTSNEKYTCVYNESKIVIFDSQMVKMFPPFQGVKFAELDKYRKERIYLFDGSYFIETNFVKNQTNSFKFMNSCDVYFASILYQSQDDELFPDVVFVLNNFVFFNFSGGKDFQKFETLTNFQQASVSLVNSDKIYLLDCNNKFYCLDTEKGDIIACFFLSDIVGSSFYPNSKMRFLNYLDGEKEIFVNFHSNSENRPKICYLNENYSKLESKEETNFDHIKIDKNSTLLEDSHDVSFSNYLFSILILKCQKQYEKKKLKEPRYFNRIVILDNQTKKYYLVHLRLNNTVTYNDVYFNHVKDCFVLSIIFENKYIEIHEIKKKNDEFEINCVTNYVIDDSKDSFVEVYEKDSKEQISEINKNVKEDTVYNHIWESLINNKIKSEKERINKYIEDYLHKLEETISEKLYSEIKMFETAIYQEMIFTQKLKNIYYFLNNGATSN